VILLLDANDLFNAVKKAACEAVEAGQPSDFCFGKVTSTSPLKISVEQRMTLGAAQLVLTRNVTNHKTKITVDSEKKEITIHNGLQTGDEVILLKQKGGQKYLVLDRVVTA
jgi:hypothetical protein